MTLPSLARRSFVRTNAPPLPGLTCWNSRILKTVPSTSMWLPFLNWLVDIEVISSFLEPDLDVVDESPAGRPWTLEGKTEWNVLGVRAGRAQTRPCLEVGRARCHHHPRARPAPPSSRSVDAGRDRA